MRPSVNEAELWLKENCPRYVDPMPMLTLCQTCHYCHDGITCSIWANRHKVYL